MGVYNDRSMMKTKIPEIQIYTTPTCHYCHMAKEYFKSKNLIYTEYDVLKDIKKREEMIRETGAMGVPIIKINGQIIIGFNKAKINELLGI